MSGTWPRAWERPESGGACIAICDRLGEMGGKQHPPGWQLKYGQQSGTEGLRHDRGVAGGRAIVLLKAQVIEWWSTPPSVRASAREVGPGCQCPEGRGRLELVIWCYSDQQPG